MNKHATILLFFILFSFSAAALEQTSSKVTWVTPDFFIEELSSSTHADDHYTPTAEDTCKEVIRNVICLVGSTSRQCLPGGDKYAEVFEKLYDNLPPTLQRMFCSLRKLYVEKEFYGTAYAGMVYDSFGRVNGVKMGIRQSVLDQRLGLSHWASWKEQLSFGGNPADSYTLTDGLPTIEASTEMDVYDLLYIIVAHEFGHMFDFGNRINRSSHDTNAGSATPWSRLSWRYGNQVLPEQDFTARNGLCFYECGHSFIPKSDVVALYDGLYTSNFISTYAATNPWDDFAESFAYYVFDKMLKMKYAVHTHQDKSYDMIEKLHSPQFAEKYKFVEEFIQRSDLKYP